MTALILSALALADASHDFSTEQPVTIDESTFVVEQADYVIINHDDAESDDEYVIINHDYVIINHDYVIINHDYQVVEYDESGSAVGTWLLSSAPTSLAEIDGVLWVGMEDGTEQAL